MSVSIRRDVLTAMETPSTLRVFLYVPGASDWIIGE